MAQWKENYTISPRENDPETGEGGKGMLRTLLQAKHATPIKQRTKAHGMDMRVPDENTAGRKMAPALQQPNERQKRNKQNARKNAKQHANDKALLLVVNYVKLHLTVLKFAHNNKDTSLYMLTRSPHNSIRLHCLRFTLCTKQHFSIKCVEKNFHLWL